VQKAGKSAAQKALVETSSDSEEEDRLSIVEE
jgi:hypothetical protein